MGAIETAIRLKDQMSQPLQMIQNNLKQVTNTTVNLKNINQNIYNTMNLVDARKSYQQINYFVQQNITNIRQARSEQGEYTKEVKKTSSASAGLVEKVKQLAAAYIGMKAASGFLNLSDEMTLIGSRLDRINDGTRTNAELRSVIYQSAQEARGSYTETLSAVAKLNLLAKDSFATNEEAVAFVEQMNKQFKLGGASVQEQKAAMQQLTQALAAGVLQGDEFRSVMENAPMLAQAIAKHIGVSTGELKKLSSEGKITADIIKNSVFASAVETDAAFASLPLTLGDVGNQIQSSFVRSLEPALAAFNELINTQSFQNFVARISEGTATVAGWLMAIVAGISTVVQWMDSAWDTVGPILGGAAIAIAAVTVAQIALNAAMAVNPVLLIIMAIGALIGYLWSLIESIGGVKVAWMLFVAANQFAWDMIKITVMQGVFTVQEFLAKLKLGFLILKNGVLNGVGEFKVSFLMLLQNMVNGGIDILNGFFSMLNKVPGVSIAMIEHVTFGASAKAEEEAKRQARDKEVADGVQEFVNLQSQNAETIQAMKAEAVQRLKERMEEAQKEQEKAKAKKETQQKLELSGDNGFGKLYVEAQKTNGNLKGIGKDVKGVGERGLKVENEDLSYLKSVFLRRSLTQINLDKIVVQVDNSFGDIHQTADLNGWVDGLTEGLRVAIHRVAEG